MSPALDRELRLAHELADLADALTLPAFSDVMEITTKADGTAVTATDVAVERRLRSRIREVFPDHAVLGEEDGRDGPDDAPTWIIDPIDATANFVRGNPVFATLIALRLDGVEMLGVVSAPALGSRWDGLVGGAARQDGRTIRVSDVRELGQAEISLGGLGYFESSGRMEAVHRAATATRRQRGFGDFWQHCLVAAGAVDVAVEAEVSTWDLAAVKPIVEAAGGRFTDFAGVATSDGGSAVSSNGHLHDDALGLFTP